MTHPDRSQKITTELLRGFPLPNRAERPPGGVLIGPGSPHRPGSMLLAARAAQRTGCDRVALALSGAWLGSAMSIALELPEVALLALPDGRDEAANREALELLRQAAAKSSCAVLHAAAAEIMRPILDGCQLGLVLQTTAAQAVPAGKAPTGAPGGKGRVYLLRLGEGDSTVARDEAFAAAQKLANSGGTAVVLEDKPVVCSGDTRCSSDSEGVFGTLAAADDVLAGIIGGLLAQGLEARPAALWGVQLCSVAAEAAAKDLGEDSVLARDLVAALPGTLRYLRRTTDTRKEAAAYGLRHAAG